MARQTATHWIRENALTRSPHRVLIVDTETSPLTDGIPEHQVLRLWDATLIRRHDTDSRRPRMEFFRGSTAGELADLVEHCARADHALWVFTHNLNFDLAVTELPVLLTERGWRVTESALTTDDPWCRLARGSRRVTIADSWSWLPASVETLGELVGRPKLALPGWEDDDDAWHARCARDVEIVAVALTQLMDWWDAGKFGNWSITGPATGWSSYRHRRPRPKVLVDPDPAARALEMQAVTGGRRDVWRIGRQPPGLYADLDLATAHLTVMAGLPLPFRRFRQFQSLSPDSHLLSSSVLDVLAECEVEVTTPRYPWASSRGVFYPVGRFTTTIAGPEIRAARARGELRSIGRGYAYVLSDHMADWARWLASLLAVETPDVPPAVRLLAKHWSRCVPGKWAGHTSEVLRRIPDPRPGWHVERGWLAEERRPADFLRIGGELWTIARDEWADDAFPAILAWIQSYTRLAVHRLLDALGPAALSVNTDGVLVDVDRLLDHDTAGGRPWHTTPRAALGLLDARCQAWDPLLAPFTVRIKSAAREVTILSPQHLILDGERRLAGIPRRAQALSGGRYRFTQWPKLRVQLVREHPSGYHTVTRTVNLAHIPPAGWLLADGRVVPVHVDQPDGTGPAQILPPDPAETVPDLAPDHLQHPLLRPRLSPQSRQNAP